MQEFEARVIDLNSKGAGVLHHPNSKVFFAPNVWPGEKGLFKITSEKKSFGTAELLNLIERSPARREALCDFHGHDNSSCGGCSWMNFQYEAQINEKQRFLKNILRKIEAIQNAPVLLHSFESASEWAYRNRARVHQENNTLGFYSSQSNQLISINKCPIMNADCAEAFNRLRQKIKNPNKAQKTSYQIEGKEIYSARNSSFEQTNPVLNERLKLFINSKLKNQKTDRTALELFCGGGNFSQTLIPFFKKVFAIDSSKIGIKKLQQNAPTNLEALCLNIYSEKTLLEKIVSQNEFNFLFLDPPRSGMKNIGRLTEKMPHLNEIYYVSCNRASFLRDATELLHSGFILKELKGFDFFPQTPHTESFAIFTK